MEMKLTRGTERIKRKSRRRIQNQVKSNNREYDSVNSSQNIVLHSSLMYLLYVNQKTIQCEINMINIVVNEITREAFYECKTN